MCSWHMQSTFPAIVQCALNSEQGLYDWKHRFANTHNSTGSKRQCDPAQTFRSHEGAQEQSLIYSE